MYSKSAVIACWLRSTSAHNSVPVAVKKSNGLVNILLLKLFIANTGPRNAVGNVSGNRCESIDLGRKATKHYLVLQISRLSEGSIGQIFATSSVIYQIKMWGL